MQDLLIIRNSLVTVQSNGEVYDDTYENFILDSGEKLPDGIKDMDYNKTNKSCWINGKAFQPFPNSFAERAIEIVSLLNTNKRNREESECLANMTEEEKAAQELAQAKAKRADAVSRIIVEVDGMKFDGDEESQSRLSRTISAAIALGVDLETEKRIQVLADNTIAEVTISQLVEALRLAGNTQTALQTVPYQG